ncbi:MAG: hypothetical protein LBG18_03735 [Mediterranea sp.]|jgi:hypothetical protein|nr:hypothetical protein [Mediterranea sp.]
MKTKHVFLMIVAGLLAASCSDDDAPDYASRIARTYTGAIELSVSGVPVSSYIGMGKTLEISRVNNDSIVAVLTIDYGTGAMAVEKVTAGAKVTYKDGKYALTGGETVTPAGSYNITATLTGEISDEKTDITISFKPGSMPMAIVARFSSVSASRTVTVDASDYMKWVYFSFENGVTGTYTAYLDDNGVADGTVVDGNGYKVNESSFDWDIAIHREDIRTNGAGAHNTEKTDLSEVTSVPAGVEYTADVSTTGKVILDMSGMMQGNIKYGPFKLNETLCGWLTKNISVMPPVYAIHNYVYVIRLADGKYAKIQFTDRTNDTSVSGHITFTYAYPVE